MYLYLKDKFENQSAKTGKGQDLAEYAVFIGLIALLVIISVTLIGGSISEIFTLLATSIQNGL